MWWEKHNNSLIFSALAHVLVLAALASPAMAGSWEFRSLEDQLPENADFTTTYKQRVFSVGTVVNNTGNQFGTYVMPDGSINSYNIKFGDNPAYTLFNSPGFVHVAAGDTPCQSFLGALFCLREWPFGARIADDGATAGWLNTLPDTSPLPGSLPLFRYPGHFVEENAEGVVATSQRSPDGAFSAVLDENPEMLVTLTDIPWVVALSSGQEPLVLGFRGTGGDCLVYGESCVPDDCADGEDDGHSHTRGVGHREHGRGYGYGHHKHDCDEATATDTDFGEPVLVRAFSDGSSKIWTFPTSTVEYPGAVMTQRFPLTMNDSTVILRASLTLNGDVHDNLMFRCDLPEGTDLNGDGVVDCINGLTPLEPLEDATSVDTVIGFSLNNEGLLTGNYGFNAAGIGRPFALDLSATSPEAIPLHNLAAESGGWELNNVTDSNDQGVAVGYGHRDCSAEPQSWTLNPDTAAGPALILGHAIQEHNGATAPGTRVSPKVPVSGGSGDYEFRLQGKAPEDAQWQPLQDWLPDIDGVTAPAGHLGDFCLRVSVRDRHDLSVTGEKVIRLRITDQPLDAPATPRTPDLIGDREPSEPLEEFTQLGALGGLSLWLMLMAGLYRRH